MLSGNLVWSVKKDPVMEFRLVCNLLTRLTILPHQSLLLEFWDYRQGLP